MNRAENELLNAAQEYCDRQEKERMYQRFLEDLLSVGAFVAVVGLLILALHLDVVR